MDNQNQEAVVKKDDIDKGQEAPVESLEKFTKAELIDKIGAAEIKYRKLYTKYTNLKTERDELERTVIKADSIIKVLDNRVDLADTESAHLSDLLRKSNVQNVQLRRIIDREHTAIQIAIEASEELLDTMFPTQMPVKKIPAPTAPAIIAAEKKDPENV